ncbi:MAG: protein kinase [Myxococcota bacterium]
MSRDPNVDWRETSAEAAASDAELVAAFRDLGRGTAFGELVRRHQIAVFRVLLAVMAAGDEAEQACEDCFVQAARDIADLAEPNAFLPWMLRMARGHAATGAGLVSAPVSVSVPGDHLRNAVRAAILRLPPDARAALMLFELEGKETPAIASILGKPLDEIEEMIDRARREFIEALQEPPSTPASPVLAPLGTGSVIDGRYRLGTELGKGGMGAVYRAYHIGLKRDVAVKVIQMDADPNFAALQERFRREAALLGQTAHEHIVQVLDFGETPEGALYLVLELLAGQTLAERLQSGPLALAHALGVARDILAGLAHLHELGIVHRDLKPSNIVLLEQNGGISAKILDLGIAKLIDAPSETALTSPGLVMGTPSYIAPEQASGKAVDGRADLYAIAVILFEMLTGQLPFRARSPAMLLAMHISCDPPPLSRWGGVFDDDLEDFVAKGLEKKPGDRFADAGVMLRFIERIDSVHEELSR